MRLVRFGKEKWISIDLVEGIRIYKDYKSKISQYYIAIHIKTNEDIIRISNYEEDYEKLYKLLKNYLDEFKNADGNSYHISFRDYDE